MNTLLCRLVSRRSTSASFLPFAFALPLAALLVGSSGAQDRVVLVGTGSSVPAPIYNRWAREYANASPNRMRYLPLGAAEGLAHTAEGTGDFGAGEVPLSEKDRGAGNLLELPVALIGIVPIYNLPGIHSDLHLSGAVLAEIFLGDIKSWDSPQIARLNPGLKLPNLPIQVVNRPAGKGSNYVFTDFLSKASTRFRSQIGVTSSPKWPVGQSVERSSDMTEKVQSTSGAIGYVEYEYAVKSNLSQAWVLNSANKYVKASPESIVAACKAVEAPAWTALSASLTNAPGPDTFPITSFTWIYLRKTSSDAARASALRNFLEWIYTQGQPFVSQEGYSELPAPLLSEVKRRAKNLAAAD